MRHSGQPIFYDPPKISPAAIVTRLLQSGLLASRPAYRSTAPFHCSHRSANNYSVARNNSFFSTRRTSAPGIIQQPKTIPTEFLEHRSTWSSSAAGSQFCSSQRIFYFFARREDNSYFFTPLAG